MSEVYTRRRRPELLRKFISPLLTEALGNVLTLDTTLVEHSDSFRPRIEAFCHIPSQLETDEDITKRANFGFLVIQYAGTWLLKAYRRSQYYSIEPIYRTLTIPEDTTYNDTYSQLIREGITTQTNITSLITYEALVRQGTSHGNSLEAICDIAASSKLLRVLIQTTHTANGFIRNSESSHWPDLRLTSLPEYNLTFSSHQVPASVPFTTGIYPDIQINPQLAEGLRYFLQHINETCSMDAPIEGKPMDGMSNGCPMKHAVPLVQAKLADVASKIPTSAISTLHELAECDIAQQAQRMTASGIDI